MRTAPLGIDGCHLFRPERHGDERGTFLKLFHQPTLAALGLATSFRESYVSTSHAGVIRGMHFQRPPHDHAKMVTCLNGRARDALVDLRSWSPTFGRVVTLLLSADDPAVLYIPAGVAHGFAAHTDNTQLWYLVSTEHAPASDAGVHPSSIGIDWWEGGTAVSAPILSERDRQFPSLADYLAGTDFKR